MQRTIKRHTIPLLMFLTVIALYLGGVYQITKTLHQMQGTYNQEDQAKKIKEIANIINIEWGVHETEAEAYAYLFRKLAKHYNVHWAYFVGLIGQESQFRPFAIGLDGEVGLGQTLEGTLEQQCTKLGIEYEKGKTGFNPLVSIETSAAYLMEGYSVRKNWDTTWRRYNGGPKHKVNACKYPKIKAQHDLYSQRMAALVKKLKALEVGYYGKE